MTEADYHRYIEAFSARDYAALEAFFTDDFVPENAARDSSPMSSAASPA